MQKEKRAVNIILSSREVVARDLPHPTPLSLLNRKQQPYFMREAEYPGTLRAAKLSGMTPNLQGVGPVFARPARTGAPLRSGFTLIELLVVVLIIGILAAVALPQYQFAVDKSRVIPYLSVIQDIVKAEQIYYMANGTYTQRFEDMDIDITNMCPTMYGENEVANCAGNISLTIFNYATYAPLYLVYCADKECSYSYANNNNAILNAYFNASTGKFISCTPYNNSTRGQKICNWLTQQFR